LKWVLLTDCRNTIAPMGNFNVVYVRDGTENGQF
jgi:hypothetical protein